MNNLAIAQFWLLLLLPLPLLVWWLAPPYRVARAGLQVPFMARLSRLLGQQPGQGASVAHSTLWRGLMLWFCWACVVLAMARPQWVEPPISKEIPVRDLLLAVDLSGSMETKDFTSAAGEQVDRLSAVKEVLDDFLAKRKGDRVGLILFGSAAFVQAPFTEDLAVVSELLNEAQIRMAGPQTAFGDALGLAINVFDRSTVNERVLIALTDGNDTTSQVPPGKAAQIAHDKGIVIHTVAVGDPKAAGEDALDEATLQGVASTTGGVYSRANDRQQLEAIYDQLNAIETRKVQSISHRPRRDVYWWPLAAGLCVSLLYFLLGLLFTRGTRAPQAGTQLASLAPVGLLAFHFIRPEWLLLLLPAAWLWWRLHRLSEDDRSWQGIIAPHLLPLLWNQTREQARLGPIHWIGLCWLVAIIAIAGPSWRHAPSPFADDTAAIAVVLKVSPSMETEDVQPSRLERATLKLHDLLALRGNAKTALVAYADSAHVVMPPTADAGIINTFAAALTPDIMPGDGDSPAAALALADQALAAVGGGTIIWLTDSVSPEQNTALARWRQQSSTPVQLWPPLLPGDELEALKQNAKAAKANVVALTADDSDAASLTSAARFAPTQTSGDDPRWAESGYWLSFVLALMTLLFFRRGWLLPIKGAQ